MKPIIRTIRNIQLGAFGIAFKLIIVTMYVKKVCMGTKTYDVDAQIISSTKACPPYSNIAEIK